MRKFIFLLIATLFAIYTQAQINSKITSTVNPTCSQDSNGSAAVIAFGGTPPYTYLWMPSGQTTDTAIGLHASITYTVMITDAVLDTDLNYVTLNPSSTLAASTSSQDVSCFGMSNGMASVLPSGGTPPYQIVWLPTMENTDTATNLPASTYTSQVTDAAGCQVNTTVPVQQPPLLLLTAGSIDSLAIAYASGGTAPYTYSWAPGGYTGDSVAGLNPGTYTITVNDANLCSNQAIITVTSNYLYFDFDSLITNCGNPDYFSFDVNVSAIDPQKLNNCVVDIEYSGGEFYGDNISNGGIAVGPESDFLYVPGSNDYNIFNATNLSDSVIEIKLGDVSDSSPNGTLITNIYSEALFHIRLKIQNSCGRGAIRFTNESYTDTMSYYTIIADSVKTGAYTTYNCDSTDYDAGCGCYTGYGCDTDWIYSSLCTNIQYRDNVYKKDSIAPTFCPMKMTSFTNPINAGTNAKSVPPSSSIMYIWGSAFGNKRDSIQVSNANGYGMVALDSSDILLWTNNLIKVKMPGVLIKYNWGIPGTGPFKVFNACGESTSSADLTISYSIEDGIINHTEKVRPNIVMSRDTASIWWRCDTSIWKNPRALACVKKAIKTWNCYTGVNWKLSPDTILLETTKQDSISVIYFSNSGTNFETPTTLMQTQRWILPDCYGASGDSIAFYDEADIQLRRDKYITTGKHWSYDMTYGVADTAHDSDYFYDDILHELGHAHGLNHINDHLSLMFRKEPPGQRDSITGGNYPGPQTLYGAFDMVNTSAAYPPNCLNDSILVTSTTQCTDPDLSAPTIATELYNLNLFPNPVNYGNITIEYELPANSSVQFKITDCTGRVLVTLPQYKEAMGTHSKEINVTNFAGGLYFFIASINGELKTIKFIKL